MLIFSATYINLVTYIMILSNDGTDLIKQDFQFPGTNFPDPELESGQIPITILYLYIKFFNYQLKKFAPIPLINNIF